MQPQVRKPFAKDEAPTGGWLVHFFVFQDPSGPMRHKYCVQPGSQRWVNV